MTTIQPSSTSYIVLTDYSKNTARLEIKRSEFIAYLLRCENTEAARDHIKSLAKAHHDARHDISAFLLGPQRNIQRSNDDGEPAGTAGLPMLQTLLHYQPKNCPTGSGQLSDVCAVVVRYFGGIKLGANGLIRAYSQALSQLLDQVNYSLRSAYQEGKIAVDLSSSGRVENEFRKLGYPLLASSYQPDQALLSFAVPANQTAKDQAQLKLAELTAGQKQISWGDYSWQDKKLPGA